MLLRASDEDRKPEERSVNCNECIKGSDKVAPLQNQRPGRYCFKWSDSDTRSDLIKIEEHKADTKQGLVGCVKAVREFQVEHGGKPDFEKEMRALKMCPWSWPFGLQEQRACWAIAKLQGDFGSSLIYPNLSVELQPNLYFEFQSIFDKAKSEYQKRAKSG